ncbi:MAG: diaminopimelate decarboxylase [Pleurocapsa minor GSE-CHR-MK-17-07R]|jgi:diaminopimelate decarboxylase|nr:diaminopimelate decarboxylase [Pleurocapsa minor GSE-CHR-MK 17-07R]
MTNPPAPYPDAQDDGLKLTFALDQIRDTFDERSEPREMFVAILDLLRTHFAAEAGAIVLLEEGMDEPDTIINNGISQGEALDLCRAAMRATEPGIIDNPYWAYTMGNEITLRGQPLGAMILVRQSEPFTTHDLHMLSVAEKQVDSAIIQARTAWKLIHRTRELEAIYHVDRLRDETGSNERSLLEKFAAYVGTLFSADFVGISLTDADGAPGEFVINGRGLPDDSIARLFEQAHGHASFSGLATPTGVTEAVFISAPLITHGIRLGSVVLGRESLFTRSDYRLMDALCSQLDTAIVHMRQLQAQPVDAPATDLSSVDDAPFTQSIRYVSDALHVDDVRLDLLANEVGTPAYVYSLKAIRDNFQALRAAFPDSRIHFSAKCNNNPAILRQLIEDGAGIDAVSAGEIHLARRAGAHSEDVVFAGVGKTVGELYYAVSRGVGWFNIENESEAATINVIAGEHGSRPRIAIRFNPEVQANTHKHIATGHTYAKFGMTEQAARGLLDKKESYPNLRFEGIHIHIGSQLGDTSATTQAVQQALRLAHDYPFIRTLDIGGGFPVAYRASQSLPAPADFAAQILPLVRDYTLIVEPGRYIAANAGVLLARVLYIKHQGGRQIVILDAGMTELIRPMLYQAHHAIVPVTRRDGPLSPVTIVGPVCESTDQFAEDVLLPPVQVGDLMAILTTGAYGSVMASNYNARLRPPEIAIDPDGTKWRVTRRRENWDDLVRTDLRDDTYRL